MNTRKNSKLRKVNKNTRRNIKSMRGGNKIANDALREYAYSSDKEKFIEALNMGPDTSASEVSATHNTARDVHVM